MIDMLGYTGTSIVGLVAGAIAGAVSGQSPAWLLALGYHRHGPSDPGDAPVYLAMGLTLGGACVGAIAGFIIGIIYSVRLARRSKALDHSAQPETGRP
jgi:hypothetical protein